MNILIDQSRVEVASAPGMRLLIVTDLKTGIAIQIPMDSLNAATIGRALMSISAADAAEINRTGKQPS